MEINMETLREDWKATKDQVSHATDAARSEAQKLGDKLKSKAEQDVSWARQHAKERF